MQQRKPRATLGLQRIDPVPGVFLLLLTVVLFCARLGAGEPALIAVAYPADQTVFPPEFPPPTFLFRDASKQATNWRIEVVFGDGSAALQIHAKGELARIPEIDPRCVATTNQLPTPAGYPDTARTWKPDERTWTEIKQHSLTHPATVTITGWGDREPREILSRGQVGIRTSKDPVGAPIFYRDVPLMPSDSQKGVIKPLANSALPLIQWRLRNVGEPASRLLMEGLHTCANCHSFSADGKLMGMDLDGPQNDKGLYAIAAIQPRMSIRNQDVIAWDTASRPQRAQSRVGFMSQLSPDGKYVMTTISAPDKTVESNYYVVNFRDYRFLQVFYPTSGILAWYDRASGRQTPLPGADNPRYVQTDGVWSPDGKYLVFARAKRREAYPANRKMAEFANDPSEVQIQYDLYRIPFNEGRGGRPEPIAGASQNGMSNTFPKVSPDGRWIVFVKCRNAQLMRPDSELSMVPAQGGEARRMRANTPLMNSWHSFSPNGRWLVFSSKSRSPYTQMFLTHLEENGDDSPAVLIENATAANRAVNIPEFVNIPPDGLLKIDVPAVEFYRRFDRALELEQSKQNGAAIAEWEKALEINPRDAMAHNNLAASLMTERRFTEAMAHFEKALDLNPGSAEAARIHINLGRALVLSGREQEAFRHFETAVEKSPSLAAAQHYLGKALFYLRGNKMEAFEHWRKALLAEPDSLALLNEMARALAASPERFIRNGKEAVQLAERAVRLPGGQDPTILDTLGMAYAAAGSYSEAIATARHALDLASRQNRGALAASIRARIALYQSSTPYRETWRQALPAW